MHHTLNSTIIKNTLNKNYKSINSLSSIYTEIAKRMIERLDYIKINPQNILDIGSGLDIDASLLQKHYSKAQLYKLDLSINILRHHRKSNWLDSFFKKNNSLIVANILALPLKAESIDLAWSNLVLPYIDNLEIYFKELSRILTIGGTFLVTGFGVDSLQQLRKIGLNTYNFPDMHLIGDILLKLGFDNPVTDLEYLTLEYDNHIDLIKDIKTAGCGAALSYRYLNRSFYNDIANRFKSITNNGKIPLTLEIFYAHAWKKKEVDNNIIKFYPKK